MTTSAILKVFHIDKGYSLRIIQIGLPSNFHASDLPPHFSMGLHSDGVEFAMATTDFSP